jgi:hypothetical protein
MKRIVAGLLTTLLAVLMIRTGLYRSQTPTLPASGSNARSGSEGDNLGSRAPLEGATDCVEKLLASARNGDAASYLDRFGGALRARLEREADERGRAAFAQLLRRAGLARKSHAIFGPEFDGDRAGAARLTVESAFADRVERQTFRLERAEGRWRVIEIETPREHVPKKALGSLATYEEPEGMPTVGGSAELAGAATED